MKTTYRTKIRNLIRRTNNKELRNHLKEHYQYYKTYNTISHCNAMGLNGYKMIYEILMNDITTYNNGDHRLLKNWKYIHAWR